MLWGLAMLPGLASANAADWLDRMNHALHSLDYQGRFVYQHGDTLEAMYLAHRVVDGNERERLISLTGLPREVIRDESGVVCLVGGEKTPDTGHPRTAAQLSPIQPIRPDRLSRYYAFEMGGTQRVAGRTGQGIMIRPLDDLRYGYWLLLDEASALPLAAATLEPGGRRVSQLLFTELSIGGHADDVPPGLGSEDTTRVYSSPGPVQAAVSDETWVFHDLPGGFTQVRHRLRALGDHQARIEHFVFSDGLATVSVYVEADPKGNLRPGMSRLGGVLAVSRNIDGHQVTAVGEVPEQTLTRFLDGIAPVANAP